MAATFLERARIRTNQSQPPSHRPRLTMNLSAPFIRRPKATLLVVFGFLGLGILAYFQLPVSALPDIDFPTINVFASLPGASAETMASAVATPLERALGGITSVTSMTSTSLPGQSQIVI